MKVKFIKKIIGSVVFIISCCAILFPSDFLIIDWRFWVTALGIFGIYFVGRYDEHNDF